MPFEPNDARFVPDSTQLRVTGRGSQIALQKTTTIDVTTGVVGAVTELAKVFAGGQGTIATAFDYADALMQAVVGSGIQGYQNYFATANAEPPTGLVVSTTMLQPGSPFIEAYVQDGSVGYGALMSYEQPELDPQLVSVNVASGAFTEIGTFPISQIALARTPASVVENLF